ncbi:MAG TPA: protein kinase [Candidatus Obscuribacterales bacterium]
MGDDLLNATSDKPPKGSRATDENDFASFINSSACLIGTTIAGRYRLDSLLGLGGWSAVYKGTDLTLGRIVAIKVLHAHLTVKPGSAQRFRTEAEAASQVTHPHLAAIYDYGLAGDHQPYIVLEFIDGKPVDVILEKEGRMSVARVIRFGAQLADALTLVHDAGMIHRDIKPGNIIITAERNGLESAKLLNFGLVKGLADSDAQTASGETFGTPMYMSPEQCSGQPMDERSDIYSLGCSLYAMASGKQPFHAANPIEGMRKHLTEVPESLIKIRPDIPIELSGIVDRALAKDPEKRFSSMDELKNELLAVPHEGRRQSMTFQRISARLKATEGAVAESSRRVGKKALSLPPAFTIGLGGMLLITLFTGAVWLKTQKFDPAVRKGPVTTSPMHSATDSWLHTHWHQLGSQQTLDFSGSDITDDGLVYLGKLPKLNRLYLDRTGVKNLEPLKNMKALVALRLVDTKIDDDTIAPLLKLHLRQLNVMHDNITDKTVDSAARSWPDLTSLSVDYTKVSDAGSPSFDRLKRLDVASLNGNNLSDAMLDHVASGVEWLGVGDTNITDAGLAKMSRFRDLKGLWAGRLKITRRGIESIGKLSSLEMLEVGGNSLADGDFSGLSRLKKIGTLNVDRTHAGDDFYQALKGMHRLTYLSMRSTLIGKHGLEKLARLCSLRSLNFADCQNMTDDALDVISRFPNLETLSLSYTRISRDGLARLKNCKTLRVLKLCGMKLTGKDLADIQGWLPQCKVFTDDSRSEDSDDLVIKRPFAWKRTAS